MEFGFLRSVESLQRNYPDQKIIICFDTSHNKKREMCKEYKADRKPGTGDFYVRIEELKKFLNCFWDLAWQYGEEADDVMYSISCKAEEVVYLLSNDNDLLQCIGDSVFVLKSHESSLYTWDAVSVKEKYCIDPDWLVMLRSFVGDKSDNLDGVPRIQKKVLANAIYDSVEKGIRDPNSIAEIMCGYTSWSVSMAEQILKFYTCGKWKRNYDLMLLQEVPYEYHVAEMNEELVVQKLKWWEINSLDLCKRYKDQLIDKDSEF
jgi:hypothetical protein